MSEIKVDKVSPQSGTALEIGDSGDTVTVPSGATLDISDATLTPPATMPASSGANLTSLPAGNLTGTIADARFPATLPAASGANLTALTAGNITGVVPTANLGTGTANATTFLNGSGAFAAPGGGGLWKFNSSGAISADTWTFSGFTTDVRIELYNMTVSSDGQNPTFLLSTDSGSSWLSSDYNYSILRMTSSSGFDSTYSAGASTCRFTEGGIGNASNETFNLIIETIDAPATDSYMMGFSWCVFAQQSDALQMCNGTFGNDNGANNINGFKLQGSTFTGNYRTYTKITS